LDDVLGWESSDMLCGCSETLYRKTDNKLWTSLTPQERWEAEETHDISKKIDYYGIRTNGQFKLLDTDWVSSMPKIDEKK
jgi:hypothetical protein